MRYGELLFPNGTLNGWTSVAGQIKGPGVGGSCSPDIAWQADTFILGDSPEVQYFTPPFTWHGFQYVEVTGPATNNSVVECYAMRSDVRITGHFESSNALLNAIHDMEQHTAEANMMSVQSTLLCSRCNVPVTVRCRRLPTPGAAWVRG